MAELAPPATMKTPVRAGLRARPGSASQELFSDETVTLESGPGSVGAECLRGQTKFRTQTAHSK